MTRELQIAQLRTEIADRKARSREAFPIVGGAHPEHIFFAAHNYHREVQELHAAEARLRSFELGVACWA